MLTYAWSLVKETVMGFLDDNCLSKGAAIAYYTIFSIGPVLIIVVAIAGLVFGQEAAQGALDDQLRGLMGDDAAKAIQGMIASASDTGSGILATILGVGALILTASGVFGEMQASLNAIWRAEPPAGLTRLLKARAASLGIVATLGFLLLVSLVVSAVISAVQTWMASFLPGTELLLQALNFLISMLLIAALFAAIYKILPDKKLGWKDVGVGAIGTAFLFSVGKTAIGLYIGSSAVASSYGAAGAFVIVLVWIYYSSQIFLLGAEFTKVWASKHGTEMGKVAAVGAQPVPADEVLATHHAVRRGPFGLIDIAALAALVFIALKDRTRT